jgi:hypothetical protein
VDTPADAKYVSIIIDAKNISAEMCRTLRGASYYDYRVLGNIKEPGTNRELRTDDGTLRTNDKYYLQYATIREEELLRVG